MMSDLGGNPIFFNKKIKIERPEHSLTPHPATSDNISFFPESSKTSQTVAAFSL